MLMSFLVWLHTVAYGALLFAPPVEPEQLVGLARARVEATLAEEPITSTLAGGTEDTHITSYYKIGRAHV